MSLVAYRSEYQIKVDVDLNRALYQRFEELSLAAELPYYLSDWQRALSALQPGFTVLLDLRRTLGPNVRLIPTYLSLHELWQKKGVGVVAELHPSVPNMRQISRVLQEQTKLPTRQFTNRTEAEAFLDGFRLGLAYQA
ncbi:hypothetical protein MTX78_18285 [Hymenobacter tibetensis]|uniref:STAS/SEC14 domain-containing protein n=1 Tax=Hymenobacter tibetensis TaxID=497967 RepID=A0ABY4CUW7_9BACT|nr:hypothetical protein [Hymenobacter tibetensis]UOG74058.1 hypothetical protein MTX78_18285 [Hymenobacter tibetensis]